MTVNEARPQGGSEGGSSHSDGGHDNVTEGKFGDKAKDNANGEAGDVDYSQAA
jgi:hypothetical protein